MKHMRACGFRFSCFSKYGSLVVCLIIFLLWAASTWWWGKYSQYNVCIVRNGCVEFTQYRLGQAAADKVKREILRRGQTPTPKWSWGAQKEWWGAQREWKLRNLGLVMPSIRDRDLGKKPFLRTFVIPLWLPFLVVAILTIIEWQREIRWLLAPPPLPGHCQRCGYDLTGNVSGVCSECGTPIPDEVKEQPTADPPKQ